MFVMSQGEEKNCRLCLKILDDDYNLIQQITREIFVVLLLKVDLSVSEEPVLCKNCMESIQEAFDFKSTCFSVDEQVVSLAIDRNSVELDIIDVYLNENDTKRLAFHEDHNICRFCLQCLEKSGFKLLSDLRENSADEMLFKCIPELDLNIIKDPVVCVACMKSLESYYSFAMKCQNTEENIMKYCEVEGTQSNGQINLSSVRKFLCKSIPQCIDNCGKTAPLKGEDNVFQNEDAYSDFNNILTIEEEELIIKEENKDGDGETEESWCSETDPKKVVKDDILTHKDSSAVVMYRCKRCTFETKYKSNLTKHITFIHKDNSKVNMYRCNLCSYEAKWKDLLRRHMLIHKDSSDVVMFRCALCIFGTNHKKGLIKHMLIHKANSDVYKCNLCSYEAKWKYLLRLHMLTHKDSSDVAMFRCTLCTFETKRKKGLKVHMLTHKDSSEVTMYKCNLCSYESKWNGNLTKHMLIHNNSSDIVMYKCESCTYETKHKNSLMKHVFIHKDNSSEVTMYKCNLCSYKTKWKYMLRRHISNHKDPSDIVDV